MEKLEILRKIEADLLNKLQSNPDFIHLEVIREAIAGHPAGESRVKHSIKAEVKTTNPQQIPTTYDIDNMTWKEKVLFVIRDRIYATYQDIVSDLINLEPKRDRSFLEKRVTVTLTHLKNADKKVDVVKESGKNKYFVA